MPATFSKTSTTDEVLSGMDLAGKRYLVTGASSGLGVETCRALVAHGADVVGTVRDPHKATGIMRVIESAAAASAGSFSLVTLDLASLESIRRCTDTLLETGAPFDGIIANAGVMATPFGHTQEGFEIQFGTNHIGHFVLINRLVPLLRSPARVVLLSSLAHRFADVDLDDPNFATGPYDPGAAYARSKTATALFAVEFDRRNRQAGIRACSVHPGAILETGLARHMDEAAFQAMMDNATSRGGEDGMFLKSVAQGAATSVWAAVVAPADVVGARYCEDCDVAPLRDDERLVGVRSYALDSARARALWTLSEDMVVETFPTPGS